MMRETFFGMGYDILFFAMCSGKVLDIKSKIFVLFDFEDKKLRVG